MVETEILRRAIGCISARGFEQRVRSDDIGLDKCAGPVDGTVHMGFGGEVHHRIRFVFDHQARHRCEIANILLREAIAWIVRDHGDIVRIGRIGQLVDIQHVVARCNRPANHCGADKAGAAGNHKSHERLPDALARACLHTSPQSSKNCAASYGVLGCLARRRLL